DHERLNLFRDSIAEGKPYGWRCRSGSRYLYICEEEKSIGARNSAAIPVFRSRTTPWKISSGNTKPKNGARPRVRSNACIRSASSTIGATRKCLKLHCGKKRHRKSAWAKSCEPSSSFILT